MNTIGDDATLAGKIAAYLEQQVGHKVQVGTIRRFPVGFSWLTFAVPVTGLQGGDDTQELILRLGPDYGLFAPYSAGPQVLAMRSLEGSTVPLPRAYWSSDDAGILGAPFLFCEKVSGSAVVPWVSANEPGCLKCHGDKRGPFPFEHAPVKLEPCSTCHEPHGSANPRMLVRHEVNRVCLECHASTFSRLGGAPPAFHDLRSARFQNCTICHSKIHGSYVSRDFLR